MIRLILLVCTGNTCRSPMAQGILKKLLQERGKNYASLYNIQSAGISTVPGMSPTTEAVKVMSEQGMDISSHRSQQLGEDLVKSADLILVMTWEHKKYLQKQYPFAQEKVFLIKELAQSKYYGDYDKNNDEVKKLEILDPLGKPISFYRAAAQDLKINLEKITDIIIKETIRIRKE